MKAQTIDIWAIALLALVLSIFVWPLFMPVNESRNTIVPILVELKVLEVNCTESGMSARLAVVSNGRVSGTLIISGKPYDFVRVNIEGRSLEGYVPLMINLNVLNGMKVIEVQTNATELIAIYNYLGNVRGEVAKMISCPI